MRQNKIKTRSNNIKSGWQASTFLCMWHGIWRQFPFLVLNGSWHSDLELVLRKSDLIFIKKWSICLYMALSTDKVSFYNDGRDWAYCYLLQDDGRNISFCFLLSNLCFCSLSSVKFEALLNMCICGSSVRLVPFSAVFLASRGYTWYYIVSVNCSFF